MGGWALEKAHWLEESEQSGQVGYLAKPVEKNLEKPVEKSLGKRPVDEDLEYCFGLERRPRVVVGGWLVPEILDETCYD